MMIHYPSNRVKEFFISFCIVMSVVFAVLYFLIAKKPPNRFFIHLAISFLPHNFIQAAYYQLLYSVLFHQLLLKFRILRCLKKFCRTIVFDQCCIQMIDSLTSLLSAYSPLTPFRAPQEHPDIRTFPPAESRSEVPCPVHKFG